MAGPKRAMSKTRKPAAKRKPAARKKKEVERIVARPVVHFEIGCADRDRAAEFYGKLFGWKMQPLGPAVAVEAGKGGIGGHISSLGQSAFQYTMFYVEVDDLEATLDKAAALGGKTMVPPVRIPTGTFAWMLDPEGNTIGLWKRD